MGATGARLPLGSVQIAMKPHGSMEQGLRSTGVEVAVCLGQAVIGGGLRLRCWPDEDSCAAVEISVNYGPRVLEGPEMVMMVLLRVWLAVWDRETSRGDIRRVYNRGCIGAGNGGRGQAGLYKYLVGTSSCDPRSRGDTRQRKREGPRFNNGAATASGPAVDVGGNFHGYEAGNGSGAFLLFGQTSLLENG